MENLDNVWKIKPDNHTNYLVLKLGIYHQTTRASKLTTQNAQTKTNSEKFISQLIIPRIKRRNSRLTPTGVNAEPQKSVIRHL